VRLVAATGTGLAVADERGARGVLVADVRCLAASGGRIWAGTQGAGVLRSDDAGETWLPAGLGGATVKSIACAGGLLVAGTQPAALFVSGDGGVSWAESESFRSMRRWYWWQPADVPHTPYVSALAVDGDTILAGLEFGRILRSPDRGRTWARPRGAALDCHALVLRGHDAYEGAGFGPARSCDAGRTWARDRRGLDRRYVMAIAADPEDRDCWYVAAAPLRAAHSARSRACVFRWSGDRWARTTADLDELPHALACPSADHVVAGLRDGTVLASRDRGATWSTAARFERLRGLVVAQSQASLGASAG
jgi:photosystem II stability/assembly factor-like uncharacterized protein